MSRTGTGPAATAIGINAVLPFGDRPQAERLIRFIQRCNLAHVRLPLSWASFSTAEGRAWYGWLLENLSAATEVMPRIADMPQKAGIGTRPGAPPRDPEALGRFLKIICSLHGHLFEAVELWERPDDLAAWNWRLDPDWSRFHAMIAHGAAELARNGKKVVLGGHAPTSALWLESLRAAGALDQVDVLGVTAIARSEQAGWQGWNDEIEPARQVAARCDPAPDVWITRAGSEASPRRQFARLEAFASLPTAGVTRAYWDDPSDLLLGDDQMGPAIVAPSRRRLLGHMLSKGGVEHAVQAVQWLRPRSLKSVTSPLLVTGGAGFIGSHIADRLASEGRTVLVFDNLQRRGAMANLEWLHDRHGKQIVPMIADIRDVQAVREAVQEAGAVIHLAGQVGVTASMVDPIHDFEVNTRGTLNVLEALRHQPVPPALLFGSSNRVYGQFVADADLQIRHSRYVPVQEALRLGADEQLRLDLHSPVGCSIGAADQYVLDYARVFRLKVAVLRMGCVFGPRQHGTEDQGWVTHFIRSALTGKQITIYGDGYQVRDLLHVDDMVEAFVRALGRMHKVAGRPFNVGGGPSRAASLLDVMTLLRRTAKLQPRIRHAPWREGDQLWYVANSDAFTEATGWRPTLDVQTAFRQTLQALAPDLPLAPPIARLLEPST